MKEKMLEIVKNPKVIIGGLVVAGVVAGLVAAQAYINANVDQDDETIDEYVNPEDSE